MGIIGQPNKGCSHSILCWVGFIVEHRPLLGRVEMSFHFTKYCSISCEPSKLQKFFLSPL